MPGTCSTRSLKLFVSELLLTVEGKLACYDEMLFLAWSVSLYFWTTCKGILQTELHMKWVCWINNILQTSAFISNELLRFLTTLLKSYTVLYFPSNTNLTLNDLSISSLDGLRRHRGLCLSWYLVYSDTPLTNLSTEEEIFYFN